MSHPFADRTDDDAQRPQDDALASERARLQRELADARSALAQVRAERDALRASRSWRITAPLRALVEWLRPAPASADAATRLVTLASYAHALPREVNERRLYVDVTELAVEDLRGGVQRVVKSVLAELIAQAPQGWTVVPVRLSVEGEYVEAGAHIAPRIGLSWRGEDRRIAAQAGDVFLGLDLVRDHARPFADALQALRAQGVATWIVVYDLLPLDLPDCFPPGIPQSFAAWFEVVRTHAAGIACISRTVAENATQRMPNGGAPRVAVFPLGADAVERVPAQRTRARSRVLMVGTIEPRKRYDDALDAFDALLADRAHDDVTLTIVGRPGWAAPALLRRLRTHPEAGKRLLWIEDADDATLAQAYADADVLLSCSRGEGFGLPLIEAARNGLSLVLRDLPEFREVAGDDALYYGPRAAFPDVVAAMRAWRADPRTAPPAPACHDWRESASSLLQAIGVAD